MESGRWVHIDTHADFFESILIRWNGGELCAERFEWERATSMGPLRTSGGRILCTCAVLLRVPYQRGVVWWNCRFIFIFGCAAPSYSTSPPGTSARIFRFDFDLLRGSICGARRFTNKTGTNFVFIVHSVSPVKHFVAFTANPL